MNWNHKINLNNVISQMNDKHDLTNVEEDAPDEVKRALYDEVMKAPPLVLYAGAILRCKSIAALNRRLDLIFTEADRTKVFCGL